MTAIVPQAVVTDNRLGINSSHAVSRLYQATLMSCGTAEHVSVDCTIIFRRLEIASYIISPKFAKYCQQAFLHIIPSLATIVEKNL